MQRPQGRCPAARAVASSRKYKSVNFPGAIKSFGSANAEVTQYSQSFPLAWRAIRLSSWSSPRLPTNVNGAVSRLMVEVGSTMFSTGDCPAWSCVRRAVSARCRSVFRSGHCITEAFEWPERLPSLTLNSVVITNSVVAVWAFGKVQSRVLVHPVIVRPKHELTLRPKYAWESQRH